MANAGDLEGDAATEQETEERAAPQPRARQARREATAAAPASRGVTVTVPGHMGKFIIGLGIGVVALVLIITLRGNGGAPAAALPSTEQTPVFDQARADQLQAALQQDPNNKDALFELGELNFDAQRNEEAISIFTRLVGLDPSNKHAMTDIGTANFNLGNPAEAKTWWQKVLTLDPNDVQAHYNMGFLYANVEPRDLQAAVNEWETVIRLDPTSDLARTAKVHVDGMKAQLQSAPPASATPGAPATAAP
jgi:cytochrome c-type biogenesis protein CcmH/NrfG